VDHASARSLDDFVRDPFFGRWAASMVGAVPALTDQLVRRVVSEVSFYETWELPTTDHLRADVEDTLAHIVRGFAGLEPLRLDTARSVVRGAAAQGVPVAAVLHIFRLGAQVIWEHVADHQSWREEDYDLDAVLKGAAMLWALVDSYSELICEIYDDTAAQRFRRSERERTLLLDALFEGRVQDLPGLSDTATILDLPDNGELVVVVAENPAAGMEGLSDIDQALRIRGIRSAWRLRSQCHMGVVVVSSADVATSLATVKGIVGERAVGRVGISPVYANLADTVSHVSLAELAMRSIPTLSKDVALFDDHPLGTLVAKVPDLSSRIVKLVLGAVLAEDDHDILVQTLQTWIEEGGSTTRTATVMYCHRNTIRNRLHRIETLSDRNMADPMALAELCLAVKGLALSR
jgi:hypothetical protein